MNDDNTARIHWSFWAIGVSAFLWNVLGSVNFMMQMNADVVATFPDTHRAIIEGRPVWATAGFAVSVFGGALGGLLLLLRKSAAFYLFVASLLGTIMTMIHTIKVGYSTIDFSPTEILMMILLPLIVAAFLSWYSRLAGRKAWVT